APALHGHSDGDVVLHAVAGALLSAASLGDLGSLFPADGRTPRGVASSELLADEVGRLAAAGWRPEAVAITITAARPRPGSDLPGMHQAVATLVGVAPDHVSIQASSGNLSGDDGAGRTLSALASATIVASGASR